jgi:hypothetical protein
MKATRTLLFLCLSALGILTLSGCALLVPLDKEPKIKIAVHPQTSPTDTAKFAMPIKIPYPPYEIYLSRIPLISSADIRGFQPIPAEDGTYGALLYLTAHGEAALEQATMAYQRSYLVTFVEGRVVSTQIIDKPVRDGQFYIEKGLSAAEIKLMEESFQQIGGPSISADPPEDTGGTEVFERVGDVPDPARGNVPPATFETARQPTPGGLFETVEDSPSVTVDPYAPTPGEEPAPAATAPAPRVYEPQQMGSGETQFYRPPFQ